MLRLASKPIYPLTLRDLVKYVNPPRLLESANFAASVLPVRLAHRIQALRSLPFIVVTNPNISKIHDTYMNSLDMLLPFGRIETAAEEERFTETMAKLVDSHANTIPILAKGFAESRRYISPAAITVFLDEHLRVRIGTRLVAEQHIGLHYNHGIVTECRPGDIVKTCEAFVGDICELRYGVRPSVVVDGYASIEFVPVHLEYIMTELLKNAFRAVIENGNENRPVEVTIAPSDNTVTIRIRDQGGGIDPAHLSNIWNYSFTTFDESDGLDLISSGTSSIAGLGYGLPLSRAYAEYFGGTITLHSLGGYGTDVYVSLKGL